MAIRGTTLACAHSLNIWRVTCHAYWQHAKELPCNHPPPTARGHPCSAGSGTGARLTASLAHSYCSTQLLRLCLGRCALLLRQLQKALSLAGVLALASVARSLA